MPHCHRRPLVQGDETSSVKVSRWHEGRNQKFLLVIVSVIGGKKQSAKRHYLEVAHGLRADSSLSLETRVHQMQLTDGS